MGVEVSAVTPMIAATLTVLLALECWGSGPESRKFSYEDARNLVQLTSFVTSLYLLPCPLLT